MKSGFENYDSRYPGPIESAIQESLADQEYGTTPDYDPEYSYYTYPDKIKAAVHEALTGEMPETDPFNSWIGEYHRSDEGFDGHSYRQAEQALPYAHLVDADPEFTELYKTDEEHRIYYSPDRALISLVYGKPFNTDAIYNYDLATTDRSTKIYQNKTITNIIGHHWYTPDGWSMPGKPLTHNDIENDAYGTYGRSLILDSHLANSNFRGVRSQQELINFVNIDPYATALHLVRGGSTFYYAKDNEYYTDQSSVPRQIPPFNVLNALLKGAEDPEKFIDLFTQPQLMQDTLVLGKAHEYKRIKVAEVEQNLTQILKELINQPEFKSQTVDILRQTVGVAYISIDMYRAAKEFIESQPNIKEATAAIEHKIAAATQFARSNPSIEQLSALIEQGSLDTELYKFALGWRVSDFSEGTSAKFRKTVEGLTELPDELLETRYASSGEISVSRAVKVVERMTPDMTKRLRALHWAHKQARNARGAEDEAYRWGRPEDNKSDVPLEKAQWRSVREIQRTLRELLDEAKLQHEAEPEKAQEIAFQIAHLEQLQDYDFSEFPKGVADLARYKKRIGSELMTLLFDRSELYDYEYNGALDYHNLNSLQNIIEHIEHDAVAQWIARRSDLSKQDKRALKDIMSVAAFKPLFETRRTNETLELEFLPARGMLLEASGHIANVCWAEKEGVIITRDNPNIDAVIMAQKAKGTGANAVKDMLAGAALLIRTTSETGDPLLVIRGLNPAQSLVDKIDIEDFVEKFETYIKNIAAKDGRKAAIVIDDHVGGSATNRPQLFSYLTQRKSKLKQVIVPEEDTIFNDYDITEDAYLLSS